MKNGLYEMFLLGRLEPFKKAKPRNCLDTNVKKACRGVYPPRGGGEFATKIANYLFVV